MQAPVRSKLYQRHSGNHAGAAIEGRRVVSLETPECTSSQPIQVRSKPRKTVRWHACCRPSMAASALHVAGSKPVHSIA